jgi:hypothetical protein
VDYLNPRYATEYQYLMRELSSSLFDKLNVVMEKTADLFANLSDVSLQVVCNTVMSLKAFSQLTQAMRTDLLGGILLPKVGYTTIKIDFIVILYYI